MLRAAELIYNRAMQRRRAKWQSAQPTHIENCKVVSVGNLTVGGTGKTPTVQFLARHFGSLGQRVAVVARGYGGTLSAHGAVVSDGSRVLATAQEAGDEPILHARALPGVPVLIGRDRVLMAQRACDEFGAQIILLDDAFQFWSLSRDVDFVLLDARQPFGNGYLLPKGRLREEPESLSRATGIMLTRTDSATPAEVEATQTLIRKYSSAPIWKSCHAPQSLRDEKNGDVKSLEELHNQSVVAISALANNEQFAQTLQRLPVEVKQHIARRDHHRWRETEVKSAIALAKEHNAALITTGKDAVKWPQSWLADAPVVIWSLQIALQVENEANFLAWLDATLQ